ncbi:MAG: replicative DNA helicase [Clostridiales bacterium]|nr:replicative DNA helicase [Clostridiales bacterium]
MADNFNIDAMELPFNLDAEQAVLGAILIDPNCLNNVMITIKPDSFYLPQHRAIYSAILSLDASGSAVDPLLVLEKLKQDAEYDDASGKEYLLQLARNLPSASNVESYCRIVNENYRKRALILAARDIIESASGEGDESDKILDKAEQSIYDIRQGKLSSGPVRIGEIITGEVYDSLQKLASPDKEQYMGIPTGFTDLDRMIVGLNKSDLVLVGARPAMGKTSFILNIARNVAVKSRKKVVFFSLEMSNEQIAKRVFSTEARVNSKKMRNGEITSTEWQRLAQAATDLNDCELYFDDSAVTSVSEMKAKIRRLKNVDCVFIDYLQLMTGDRRRSDSRTNEVSDITRALKIMAKELHIPVVVCSQLSRNTEVRGQKHKPQLADLRESGSIEQDADIVLMLYREDYYDKDEPVDAENVEVNEAEVLVRKNRHGDVGEVKLNWDPDYTLFSNKEKVRNDS